MMTVYAGPRGSRSGEHRSNSKIGQQTIARNMRRAGASADQISRAQAQAMTNGGRVRSTRGMTNG